MVNVIPAAVDAMEVSRSVLSCLVSALNDWRPQRTACATILPGLELLPSVEVHMTCSSFVRHSQGSKGPGIGGMTSMTSMRDAFAVYTFTGLKVSLLLVLKSFSVESFLRCLKEHRHLLMLSFGVRACSVSMILTYPARDPSTPPWRNSRTLSGCSPKS
jgi:hypothetical protein